MSGIVFDTSIYISALRQGDPSLFSARRANRSGDQSTSPLWLSAVVLEELYAGAQSFAMKKICAAIEKSFDKIGRLLTPVSSDWVTCGQVLSRIGQKYGYEQIGRARMTNDTLIAVSAVRNGLTVFTKNAEDFKMIAEFRHFDWEEL